MATTMTMSPVSTATPMRPGTFGQACRHAVPRSLRRPISAPRSTVSSMPVSTPPSTSPTRTTIPDTANVRPR